jgi:hypothetical protein
MTKNSQVLQKIFSGSLSRGRFPFSLETRLQYSINIQISRGIHNETVIFYPDPIRRILTDGILQELSTVDVSSPGPTEVYWDCGVLNIIPYMLERAAKTRQVENILRNHPFKSDDVNDVLHDSKQKCAEAASAYLEVSFFPQLHMILRALRSIA